MQLRGGRGAWALRRPACTAAQYAPHTPGLQQGRAGELGASGCGPDQWAQTGRPLTWTRRAHPHRKAICKWWAIRAVAQHHSAASPGGASGRSARGGGNGSRADVWEAFGRYPVTARPALCQDALWRRHQHVTHASGLRARRSAGRARSPHPYRMRLQPFCARHAYQCPSKAEEVDTSNPIATHRLHPLAMFQHHWVNRVADEHNSSEGDPLNASHLRLRLR